MYTKLAHNQYNLDEFQEIPHYTEAVANKFYVYEVLQIFTKNKQEIYHGQTELDTNNGLINKVIEFTKVFKQITDNDIKSTYYLSNVTRLHLGLYILIIEPLNVLRPLVQIGIMKMESVQNAVESINFWEKQDNFI